MTPRVVFIAAVLAALTGCSTVTETPSGPPVAKGEDTTPWGVLPRYEQAHLRPAAPRQTRRTPPASGQAVADVLVDRDGTIRDIRILEATNSGIANAALELLHQSRYEPLPPDGPGRYVVRQNIVIKTHARSSGGHIDSGQDGGGNSSMPANQPWPNVGGRN